MKNISGSTTEEAKMIKAIQTAVDSIPDGSAGAQTMSDIAVKLGANCFPLALDIYSNPVIIAKDLTVAAVKASLGSFANSISGSFSYQQKPCSIMISNGNIVCGYGCHAHLNKPESVLYRLQNGEFGIKRVTYATELPSDCRWAIGGVGLLGNYNTSAEGFTGAYSDVLRKTNHTLVGVKNGMVYLCYARNMNASQVNAYATKLGLEKAVMLDGGHVAAINSANTKININQTQFYIVQAI